MKKIIWIVMAGALLLLGPGSNVLAGEMSPDLEAVLDAKGPDEAIAVILTFTDKVIPNSFKNIDNKGQRRSQMVKALKSQSAKNMQAIENVLETQAVSRAISLWGINGAALTATPNAIRKLAKNPKVGGIRLDKKVSAPAPAPEVPAAPEWNITAVNAPILWDLGITGTGVVVASMDTGVDATHPDLAGNWRGGSNSWFDPSGQHDDPYDANGHGTQVMGIMVGSETGVAPGAKWIAAKIFNDAGTAPYSAIHQGFQWLLDPDRDPDTDDAPDIVNNSWNLSNTSNLCIREFQNDIFLLKAAEIAVVFSGGNSGPYENTSVSPANNSGSFAVGALTPESVVAWFSSRGPNACDGEIYPRVVAPGVGMRTTDLYSGGDPDYVLINPGGTSIAAPHVSGVMALLLEAHPYASVNELEAALVETALDLGLAEEDDTYGYGLIDAAAAEGWLANSAPLCIDDDADGFFDSTGCGTSLDCNDFEAGINPDACDIKGDGIDQDCDGRDRTKGKPCPSDGGDDGGTDPVVSEGKGKTCTDGIDNDGDGSIDCGDSDCIKNKACK